MEVTTIPGLIALTRIFCLDNSEAKTFTVELIDAFEAAYSVVAGTPSIEDIEEIKTKDDCLFNSFFFNIF
jgi:hypothetical protein